jgi:hypothetical protein
MNARAYYNPEKPSYGQADFYCHDCRYLISPESKEYGALVSALQSYTHYVSLNPESVRDSELSDRIAKSCGVYEFFCWQCAGKDRRRKHHRCDRCYQAINDISGVYDADNDIGFCESCGLKAKRKIVPCCNLFVFKCMCAATVIKN